MRQIAALLFLLTKRKSYGIIYIESEKKKDWGKTVKIERRVQMHINQKVSDFVTHCLYMNSIQYGLNSVAEVERKIGQLLAMEDILLEEIQLEENYSACLAKLVESAASFGRQILEHRRKQL